MNVLVLGPSWRNNILAEFLGEQGHTSVLLDTPITLDFIRSGKFDLVLSSGYAYKISADIVEQYFGKIINLHATYLPWGKGIGTTLFSLLEGTPKGVSLHLIDIEFDVGDIIAQKKVDPAPGETLRVYYHRLLQETTKLFFENFEAISAGTFTRTPQLSIRSAVPYRSRVESEHFMDYLPMVWDTPISDIEQFGAELGLSESFWSAVEAEMG